MKRAYYGDVGRAFENVSSVSLLFVVITFNTSRDSRFAGHHKQYPKKIKNVVYNNNNVSSSFRSGLRRCFSLRETRLFSIFFFFLLNFTRLVRCRGSKNEKKERSRDASGGDTDGQGLLNGKLRFGLR